MSYSYELKKDFIKRKNAACCGKAVLFSYLYFSGSPFPGAPIKVSSDLPEIAVYLSSFVSVFLRKEIAYKKSSSGFTLSLNRPEEEQLQKKLSFSREKFMQYLEGKNCCRTALLRGAFLSCGHLSSPEKGYHLEFTCRSDTFTEELILLLSSFDLPAKITKRKEIPVVYIKSGEVIRDFLAKTGSTTQFFDFTNVSIVKSLRNSVNRQVNCENANIDKTVLAAEKHRRAILSLREAGVLLPANCLEIAELRLANPDASLEQLGLLCSPPLSKAGVSHRLKKICLAAEKLEKENQ